MSGNSFGRIFSFTTFGESHGEALGVVIDGMPSGIKVDEELLSSMLERRAPGKSSVSTQRKEADTPRILSGVWGGVTTGTPIAVTIENRDQHSSDYEELAHVYRPGHADYTYSEKYGIRDYRGGGRSSGRETVARVIAGAFAKMVLEKEGISVDAGLVGCGTMQPFGYSWNPPFAPPLYSPLTPAEQKVMLKEIEKARKDGDSIGGVVECRISGSPAGLGEPVFDKLDALLSHAVFSIGAVKGFEVGSGIQSSFLNGSLVNDGMRMKDGKVSFTSNNAGGILGGISRGDEIITRAYFKPTPSIASEQNTVTDEGKNTTIVIKGRHDPCIAPRAVVVVEAMESCVILDCLLMQRAYGKR